MSGTIAGVATLALTLTVLGAPTADSGPQIPELTDTQLTSSILALEAGIVGLEPAIIALEPAVEEFATTDTSAGDTALILNSDILFGFGEATLSDAARAKIGELAAQIPQGAAVKVGGHTDAIGSDADNLTLSQQRAQAVADALTAARGDLVLDVQGFGEAQPVQPNTQGGQDNPDGRAKNRRVEVRWA